MGKVKELVIAVEVVEVPLGRQLLEELRRLPDVRGVQWLDAQGEKGPKAAGLAPDVIVIDDQPAAGELFRRLGLLRQGFPQAALFVVSADKRPERIVEVMKAGVAEYLVVPVNRELLDAAVGEVRTRLVNAGHLARGEVVSFVSSKGGLGATVIAVNSAAALVQQRHERVALFDLSLQSGDASVLLDLLPETSIGDISRNFHRLDVAFLRGAMVHHKSGLEFLAAPQNPEEARDIAHEHIARILELGCKLFDHLLIDCTSMLASPCSLEAFQASSKVFLVTDLSVPAVRNAARLLRLLEKSQIPPERIEVVVNRFIRGGTLGLDEAEKTLGRRAFWLFPNDFADVVSSINDGIPLVLGHPGAPFARNVTGFVDKLLNPHAHEDFRGIRGAFGRAI